MVSELLKRDTCNYSMRK